MIVEYVALVRERLKRSLDEMIHQTGTGSAISYEDYRHRVGIELGMQRALDEINETYREFMREDQNGE